MLHFVGEQWQKRPVNHLLTIRREEGESLRPYVRWYNREVLEVNEAEDKV